MWLGARSALACVAACALLGPLAGGAWAAGAPALTTVSMASVRNLASDVSQAVLAEARPFEPSGHTSAHEPRASLRQISREDTVADETIQNACGQHRHRLRKVRTSQQGASRQESYFAGLGAVVSFG